MFLSKIFNKFLGKKSIDDKKPNELNLNDQNEPVIECDVRVELWNFKSKTDLCNDNFEENFMNNYLNKGLNEESNVEYIDNQQINYKGYNYDPLYEENKFKENFMNDHLNNESNYHVEYIDEENFLNNHSYNESNKENESNKQNESNKENESNKQNESNDCHVEYIDDQQNSFNSISNQNNFFNIIDVYTDGSKKRNGLAGSSFTLENHTTGHVIYKIYRLSNYCTSTCSELSAIYQALEFLINNELSTSLIRIYTDFEHAERYLSDDCNKKILGSRSNIDLDIFRNQINNLRSANNTVIIKWIKKNSHVLNQYADLFAKRGSRLNKINFNVSTIQIKKN